MKILLTGANGYIGKRLLPALVEDGHEVVCLVRDPARHFVPEALINSVTTIRGDLLDSETLETISKDIDIAYYLVHSMGQSRSRFFEMEQKCAANFVNALQATQIRQIIYLSGIVNDEQLSKHLISRKTVEDTLKSGKTPVTVLRAGIIIGSGSASFEIIRDLVEKLPLMIAPKWVNNRIQPIGIFDVIHYLRNIAGNEKTYEHTYDIGGPDVLTYRQMLVEFARIRGLKRTILNVPLLSPRLSSYWLYLVTPTSFSLARSLVDSLKNEVVCKDNCINQVMPHKCMSYEAAVRRAFSKIAENLVVSSWKDALVAGRLTENLSEFIEVPVYGCLQDKRSIEFERDPEEVLENIWSIGGERGWYRYNTLWKIRGFMDKMVGGVGLRRGRTKRYTVEAGDVLDFWRVLLADRQAKRLLLYAEMKLPGEAWLEFKIKTEAGRSVLMQTATFRPSGLWGRIYWYSVLPFHELVFGGMLKEIVLYREQTG